MIPWFPQTLLRSAKYENAGKYYRGTFEPHRTLTNETVQMQYVW